MYVGHKFIALLHFPLFIQANQKYWQNLVNCGLIRVELDSNVDGQIDASPAFHLPPLSTLTRPAPPPPHIFQTSATRGSSSSGGAKFSRLHKETFENLLKSYFERTFLDFRHKRFLEK